jgi:hypothetical protein
MKRLCSSSRSLLFVLGTVVVVLGTACQGTTRKLPAAPPHPPGGWVRVAVINGRVRYSVPSEWTLHTSVADRLDESRAPFNAANWYTFPYPLPEGKTPTAGLFTFLDEGKTLVIIETWLMTNDQTLTEFSEDHRRRITNERVIGDSTKKGLRMLVTRYESEGQGIEVHSCFRARGRVGVALFTGYTTNPMPPQTWRDATEAQIRRVCSSIRIVDKRSVVAGGAL